jgi:hypothetical protein
VTSGLAPDLGLFLRDGHVNLLLTFWVHPVSACVCETPQGEGSLHGHAEYVGERIHVVIHGVKRSGLTVMQTYLLRIFYVVDGQGLPMTEPWPLASEWDGYRALKSTRRQLWKTISHIRGYGPEDSPTTYPRGRVSYWELSKRFDIRLDRHLHYPEIIRAIVQEFHLPEDYFEVRVDTHYDCEQCRAERESEEVR